MVALAGLGVLSATANSAPADSAKPTLEPITVEAQRQMEREVSRYVSTVVVHYLHDSLARWDTPICPLVAGLDRDRGEFVLQRISQIAAAVHAPLDGEHCKPNFYVVATSEPEVLLKKWWRRNPTMYKTANGMGSINRFMHAPLPIRSWYNSEFRSSDGSAVSSDSLVNGLSMSGMQMMQVPINTVHDGSRLKFMAVQSLSSVIIVVDTNRTRDINLGQLSDYVAMAGLAEIRVDADLGGAPTILRLFHDSKNPPRALSSWDQAFLFSLYNTSQASTLQASTIKLGMIKQITTGTN